MPPKPKESSSDLFSPQTTSAVAGGIDCEQLFALMTQQLILIADTRRPGKLYSPLQKELEALTDHLKYLQTEGLHWLRRAARYDSLPAIDYLVKLYQPHPGRIAQNYPRRYLRQRVALRGNVEDLYALTLHLTSPQTGLRKNYREASDYLHMAIQLDHPKSHLPLAQMYQRGLGVVRSHEQYLYHLGTVAEAGLVEAQIVLAGACAQDGFLAQMERVEYWLTVALRQDAPEAYYLLGKLWYHQDGDCYNSRIVSLWKRAIKTGIPKVCYEVGRMFLADPLQPARHTEATCYLCQAAQSGALLATQLLYRHHYDVSE